ncbi:MAG: glycosyltransferase family 2 protein [Acidobacteriaceae bacterium]
MVCGVVISYNPSAAILANIELLHRQVGHVVVVDNTPSAHVADVLKDLENLDGCTVIRNGKNLGIAAALNIGIRHAISLGFPWIITFDQDSRVGDGFVAAMLAAYRGAAKHAKVGILCPRYLDARAGVFLPTYRAANGDVFACMTSGSMIHADTFRSMGPMEERLFMDYVDYEYCLRMRLQGFKVIESPEAILQHSLGRIGYEKFLGRRMSTTNHSPQRRYYINRNRLVLIRRYLFRDTQWASRELKSLIKDSAKVVLLEKQKTAKAGYMLRALFDGLFNRLGQRVPL